MFFPHLTAQQLTINGSWQEDNHYLRFTGTISSSAPFVILSLLNCGETYHYMKHNKSDALEVSLDLYQSKFPHDNRYQHSLTIGHSVNLSTVSEGRLYLSADLPITFQSGRVFTFAMDTQHQPFISLVAIAKVDIKSKRNGIWALKPRLLGSLDASWLHILSKTRHGVTRIQ
ncbi:MAG: hypothetical protein O7G88_11465 [bacterium]|nr:hypothetical protein [bacterium]